MGNNHSAASSPKTPMPPPERPAVRESVFLDEVKVKDRYNYESVTSATSKDCSGGLQQLESGSASDLALALLSEADENYFAEVSSESEGEEDEEEKEYSEEESIFTDSGLLPPALEEDLSMKLKVYSSSDVRIESQIGEGEFGKVSKAILQGKHKLPVAIKAYNASFDGDTFGQLNEIMKLKHRNVVTILGVLDSGNWPSANKGPKVILHYFPEGNLLQFLMKPNNPQDYATLVKLALDVAQGCEYLHSKNVIHGNLAARNILVEKQRGKVLTHYNAKVTDHGLIHLAKAKGNGRIYQQVNNGIVLPIRWVPKELLEEGSNGFTFASDVWSFGIVLWEILTKGSVPYGRKKEEWKVKELILDGQSPLNVRIPQGYPDEITDVMKQILKENPEERPRFYDVRRELISISANIKSQSKLDNQYNPAMKRNASGHDVGRRRRHESGGRRRSRDSGSSCGSSVASGRRTPEKFNFLKRSDENLAIKPIPNDLSKATESKDKDNLSCYQNMSRNLAPPKPQNSGNGKFFLGPAMLRRRESNRPSSPPISAFHAMSSQATNFPPAPPPPYTPNPLPNHSAYGGRGRGRRPPRQGGGRGRVNYSKEIKKKEHELEVLRLQKLRHEASATWDKMQSIMSQLTDIAGVSSASSAARRGGADMRHHHDTSYDRSRICKPPSGSGSSSGRGPRSRSRGKRGEASTLTSASTTNGSVEDNVF